MIRKKFIPIAITFFVATNSVQPASANQPAAKANADQRIQHVKQSLEFELRKASCLACQKQIERALKSMKGVQSVLMMFGSKPRVVIAFDSSQTSTEQIFKKIKSMGYDVGPAVPQDFSNPDEVIKWLKQQGYKTSVEHIQMPGKAVVGRVSNE